MRNILVTGANGKLGNELRLVTCAYKHSGICHYNNEGVFAWFDFTKMIAEYVGNRKCEILPCHSEEFPSLVKRLVYSVLNKTKIKDTFEIKVPYRMDSLRQCLRIFK